MVLFTLFYAAVIAALFFYMRRKMKYFKRIGYKYDYPLGRPKFYFLISLGSFLGGLNGGIFALGNTTTIIFTMICLGVEPIVVSATCGFQVVFSAAASLVEGMINGDI